MNVDLEPVELFEAPIYLRYHATSSRAVTPFLMYSRTRSQPDSKPM